MLQWYFILSIALGSLIFVVLIGVIVARCVRLNNSYAPVSQDVETGHEEEEKATEETHFEEAGGNENKLPKSGSLKPRSLRRVRIDESSAEKCNSDRSDLEEDDTMSIGSHGSRGSLGSCGSWDSIGSTGSLSNRGTLSNKAGSSMSGSVISLASNASWTSSKSVSNLNLNVQCSLVYSREKRHVAGKIIQCDGLTFFGNKKPTHVRVHVVVLPIKKYALKTSWYQVPNDTDGRVKIGEYFKFVFKLPPSELKTILRVRLYGRKTKVGSLGRPSCMGECYVTLLEVINSKGGLTLWRALSRGIPEAILEGQTD